jgi:hypothetical protein
MFPKELKDKHYTRVWYALDNSGWREDCPEPESYTWEKGKARCVFHKYSHRFNFYVIGKTKHFQK